MNLNFDWRVRKMIDHIWGPTGSIILHIVMIFVLLRFFTGTTIERTPEVEVVIMEPDATDLEDFQKEIDKLEELPDVVDPVTPPEVSLMEAPPDVQPSAFASSEPTVDFAALDVQNDIQSPLVMKGLFQGRSAGGRAAALKN